MTASRETAYARMVDMGFGDEDLDFIFAPWTEPDHYDWLMKATREEIIDWIARSTHAQEDNV